MQPQKKTRYTHAASRLGEVVAGKWRLKRLLGIGGMGAVYLAEHETNGREVALKALHPELCGVPDAMERFRREACAINHVQHPGCVPILDDGLDADGTAFMVMDVLRGETVEQKWGRNGHMLPQTEVLRIADRLLEILTAAHDKGVIHRDVKPENVFLTEDDDVRLIDFGIAHFHGPGHKENNSLAGNAMGTPTFMSPEQARGRWEELDARADVFSVGATMFMLLSGRTIHEAGTNNELLLAAMTQAAPSIATFVPHLPAKVSALVDRALAFKPADRYQDARSMQEAVESALEELETHPELGEVDVNDERPNAPRFFPPMRSTYRSATSPGSARRLVQRRRLQAAAIIAAGLVLSSPIIYSWMQPDAPLVENGTTEVDAPETTTSGTMAGTLASVYLQHRNVAESAQPEQDIPTAPFDELPTADEHEKHASHASLRAQSASSAPKGRRAGDETVRAVPAPSPPMTTPPPLAKSTDGVTERPPDTSQLPYPSHPLSRRQ